MGVLHSRGVVASSSGCGAPRSALAGMLTLDLGRCSFSVPTARTQVTIETNTSVTFCWKFPKATSLDTSWHLGTWN